MGGGGPLLLLLGGSRRRDLWARLATCTIRLPALRDRAEDIFALAQALASRSGTVLSSDGVEVEAVERLLLHEWPNNVRELAAVIDGAARLDHKPGLRQWTVEKLLGPSQHAGPPLLTEALVEEALAECGGNESQAARKLGVTRGRLRRFQSKK